VSRPGILVSVTDHAVERYRQRVAGRLDPRAEIAGRVSEAWAAGRVEAGERATVLVRDLAPVDDVAERAAGPRAGSTNAAAGASTSARTTRAAGAGRRRCATARS